MVKKAISLILSAAFVFSLFASCNTVLAEEETSVTSLSDRRAQVKKELDAIDKKLAELGSKSKETKENYEELEKKNS